MMERKERKENKWVKENGMKDGSREGIYKRK